MSTTNPTANQTQSASQNEVAKTLILNVDAYRSLGIVITIWIGEPQSNQERQASSIREMRSGILA